MRFFALFLGILLLVSACASKGGSALSEALVRAVKEKKISEKKMENILTEYDKLRDEDKSKARQYVEQVVSAIEMGGDSTHIDVARKFVLRRQGQKEV